ncbi:MAG: ribosomal RNA small subunit methyltransferase A [Desulfobacteraceae bacterium]|nr:ribosomal RNA small subunit methyltransferase A [Desulfobacteraceae bacterium]
MAETKPVGREQRFRPKKRLSQHFLQDTGIIHEIIAQAGFDESDHVFEIGAGLGALTLPLSKVVRHITAIEKDAQLADMLGKRLSHAGVDNVNLINDDILAFDLSKVIDLSLKKIKVIGNLPYNISSPLLEKFIKNRNLVSRAILMFQYEFARRLIAPPGNKEYGAMTVLIQYHAGITPLLDVPKEAFYPKPKVDSMVLELDLDSPHPRRTEDEETFKMVVKGAFAHRRKTLLNSLKGTLSSRSINEIVAALDRCAIDPTKRAENLDIDDFLCLTSQLTSLS